MRHIKYISIVIIMILLNVGQAYAQMAGSGDPGNNVCEVPLDGGLLVALLAGGSFVATLLTKKKKKE